MFDASSINISDSRLANYRTNLLKERNRRAFTEEIEQIGSNSPDVKSFYDSSLPRQDGEIIEITDYNNLLEALKNNSYVRHVSFDRIPAALPKFISTNSTIKELSIKVWEDDENFIHLLEELKNNSTISALKFRCQSMTQKQNNSLCQFIKLNQSINWLDINDNGFSTTMIAISMYEAMIEALQENKTVKILEFSRQHHTTNEQDGDVLLKALSLLFSVNQTINELFLHFKCSDSAIEQFMAVIEAKNFGLQSLRGLNGKIENQNFRSKDPKFIPPPIPPRPTPNVRVTTITNDNNNNTAPVKQFISDNRNTKNINNNNERSPSHSPPHPSDQQYRSAPSNLTPEQLQFIDQVHSQQADLSAMLHKHQIQTHFTSSQRAMLDDPIVEQYYINLQTVLVDIMLACKTLHSGWVKLGYVNKKDYAILGAELLSHQLPFQVPGVSAVVKTLQYANDYTKKQAIESMATFCVHLDSWAHYVICVALLASEMRKQRLMELANTKPGLIQKLNEMKKSALRTVTEVNDNDTPMHKLADEDARRLSWAIMENKLNKHKHTLHDCNNQESFHLLLQDSMYELTDGYYIKRPYNK